MAVFRKLSYLFLLLLLCAGCENNMVIVTDVEEREANEIVVFLASKGIPSTKTAATGTANPAGGTETGSRWNIGVDSDKSVAAMAVLNRNGLPRKTGPNRLDIFAKGGFISSATEENIRYQAGLAGQIAGTIRKIDGVIDADVELSIPPEETGLPGTGNAPQKRITAAVYVKHQGILDDPNSHLILKIKRLVAGSIAGLDVNDVTVISDRARYSDISLTETAEQITPKAKEYVSIWSIVMSQHSASRFRVIFFTLLFFAIAFAVVMGWLVWKVYPIIRRRGGIKKLFSAAPFDQGPE